tara:strand:- start:138 stop:524 length:387 start_codon:yes stop_codon:yes gene_type:complete
MNTENLLILVLVIVLLVLVVMFVRNNRENFRSQTVVLHVFVVDWCPHCTRAKPEVAKLKNNLNNSGNKVNNKNVRVNLVNAEENKDLARKHNVNAYPTCVLELPGGETVPFNENVTANNLNEFLNNNV